MTRATRRSERVGGPYAWYVLIVLMFVYMFNFIDRSILTILAPFIQKDMGLSDAQIGLLSGTVFALFYGLFGLALGRLADTWVRTWTIALGLTLWSGMTALSGFATSFGALAAARVGVGVGEASASPAAYSLIGDWFPKDKRATALSIYSSGIYIGAGLSLVISSLIVKGWDKAYAHGSGAPLGLVGWQAAFLMIGVPGILLALLVATLREPPRGLAEVALATTGAPRRGPVATVAAELATIMPPFTWATLRRDGAGGGTIRANLLALLFAVAAAVVMTRWTDSLVPAAKLKVLATVGGTAITANAVQWAAMAIGGYGIFSWAQSLSVRDKPLHTLIWRTPAFLLTAVAGTLISFTSYALGAWSFIYALRTFHLTGAAVATTGIGLGFGAAFGGLIGTSLGGIVGDAWRKRSPTGRLKLSLLASILPVPIVVFAFTTASLTAFVACYFFITLISTFWLGGVTATMQDLVLPRMRGTAGAMFFMGTTLIGLGNGPYLVGLVSDATGDLRLALASTYFGAPVVWLVLLIAIRLLPASEASRIERARAAGEAV